MQISEIRLAGFKSFVDPTTVPVLEGLTGVVGPNGCGKSNLLEALRWAMGASSARAMRGDEMDDLIFAGTDTRPPRELAEVTLLLDNTRRTAPAAFNDSDTLEITRRLRRGAGSSYRINSRTVRARDIQLIFADASTGANSPALVRQGQISELIASKPQNRRRILEEAAGISGLHARRHETETRLQAAQTNLEKLGEVSAEIERQLESLKRQARKARKYRDLTARIQAMEAHLAHLRWMEAEALATQAAMAREAARLAVERTSLAAALAEREAIDATNALGPLRAHEQTASGRLADARIALARLEARRQALREQQTALREQVRRLEEDHTAQAEQADDAAQMLAELSARLERLPAFDPEANRQEKSRLTDHRENARLALSQAERQADEAAQRLAAVRAQSDVARTSRDALIREGMTLEGDRARLSASLAGLPEPASLHAALATTRSDMAARDEARAATQTRLSEAEADERSARAALETFRQRHDDLDRRVREAEAEANGLERVLTPPVPGRVAPVLTMLTIASGYEKALAAALGDDLNAPVASQGATRWHDAAETRAAGLPPLPDGAEPLAPHVIAPKALAARLAQIGWVRDAQAGAQIAPRLLPGQRMVSLEGHLWRWDGFTRTPDAPLPEAERLHQRARLERVKAELTKARTDRQDAAAALEDARRAARDADALLRSLRTMLADAVRDLASARESVLRAEAASEASGLRRQAADDNLARTQNRLSAIAEALAQLPAPDANALTPLEKALTTARDRLTAARQADNAAQLALAEHERQAEQAEGRRRAISRDLEEWTRRRDRARERLNEIASRRDAARAALDATPDGQDGETDAEALSDDVRRLERERQQAADAVARADTAQREADTRSRQATRDAAESRQADASAVAALLAAETRREELDATIRAQFGCTPAGLPGRAAGLDPASLEDLNLAAVERDLLSLRNEREALGGVNPEAEAEAADLESRLGQQAAEKADLTAAIARLREGIDALNAEGRDRLMAAFESVRGHFAALFTALFQGGQAELRLVDADDPLAAGLEIFAQPPGKRLSTLSLMSGGEQALTATALIFAVFLSNPAPICVLDEVDAPLDDANVDRFCRLLDEMRQRTQTRFLVITHNPVTMSRMDRLYGVTMRERGVSKLVSVDLRTAEDLVAAQ